MRKGIVVFLAGVALAAGLSALLVAAQSAEAAFAGRNGKVVFTSDGDALPVGGDPGDREVFTMSSNGTGIKRLTNNSALEETPAWSPNGRKIVYRSDQTSPSNPEGDSEIYVMNADGSGKTNVTDDNQSSDITPSFSPDGRQIVFSSSRNSGPGVDNPDGGLEIFTIKLDGTGLRQLTFSASPTSNNRNPAFSPNGEMIVFESFRDDNEEIYVMEADGTDQINLTDDPAARDASPSWSPDGRKIAFDSDRTDPSNPGDDAEVYTMNADGLNPTRLTTNTAGDSEPAYAPDGRQIVFVSDRDGNAEIYRMRTDGSLQTLLTNNHLTNDWAPDWQPLKRRR